MLSGNMTIELQVNTGPYPEDYYLCNAKQVSILGDSVMVRAVALPGEEHDRPFSFQLSAIRGMYPALLEDDFTDKILYSRLRHAETIAVADVKPVEHEG